jgi:RNA polymerase sigma factor (sigma-70 family)
MQDLSDLMLLRDYAERGHEAAFSEIVRRHTDVVYASALRQAGSPDPAQDIAQSVFSDLARKARTLASTLNGEAALVGWLYRSTRFAALNQLRDDRRWHTRERHAMEHPSEAQTPSEWEGVQPVLDEVMAELNDEDREALLLRFFKAKDFRAIGVVLGISDDAAQKRVTRALERLRTGLTSRGAMTTGGALSALLLANTISFAPAGMAAIFSTTALAGTTLAAAATATVTKAIAMTTLQKTLIATALSVALVTGLYGVRQNSKLRELNQILQRQQTPAAPTENVPERSEVLAQLAALREENARLNSNTADLLRLRAEVALLRQNSNRARAAQQETNQLAIALAESQSKVERLEFEKLDRSISSDMVQLVSAMRMHPQAYNGFMATNFDQIISELSVKTNTDGSVSLSESGNDLSLFEFVNVGQANDTLPQKLIFREKTPRRTPDGNWARVYGRAGGSVEKRVSSTGDFELWERASDPSVLPTGP